MSDTISKENKPRTILFKFG